MENFNLLEDVTDLLNHAHTKCQIELNAEEYEFMFQELLMFLEQISPLNIFNERTRNIEMYNKYWQRLKMREDIPEHIDVNALLINNKKMKNGYFLIKGSLYEGGQ